MSDRLRRFGVLGLLAVIWRAAVRLFVGSVPFCPWPGCWERVDPTCSGRMFEMPDERYCTKHCTRYHRDRQMTRILGVPADCPTKPRLRSVSAERRGGGA